MSKTDYDQFLLATDHPYCWQCGREWRHQPRDWFAPWIIERAHVVSSPRAKDRRAVILLCSGCHRASHGINTAGDRFQSCELRVALWLKRTFDPDYFDLEFLQRHSIVKLPRPKAPSRLVMEEFCERQGQYPSASGSWSKAT